MKATGITRTVDDFFGGGIVIPKEIRRTLKTREGAPLIDNIDTIWRVLPRDYKLLYTVRGVIS